MRLAARKVARILADARQDPTSTDWVKVADKCLLLLALPKRKVRPRDPRKAERKVTLKQLDRLCRDIVFHRDGFKCRRCGKTTGLQWSHVYTRETHAVRWDLDNSKVLCAGCHKFWWHKVPAEAGQWWEKEIGSPRMASLALRANGKGRGKPNYVAILADLEQEARRLNIEI